VCKRVVHWPCLRLWQIFIRNPTLRDEFRSTGGVDRLIPLLQSDDSQLLYRVTFTLWVMSFDPQCCAELLRCGAVKALSRNRATVRTKVMRVAVAALAVRDCVEGNGPTAMSMCSSCFDLRRESQNVARDEEVGAQAKTVMGDTVLSRTLQTLQDENKVEEDAEMVGSRDGCGLVMCRPR